jgi:hypothetical protein
MVGPRSLLGVVAFVALVLLAGCPPSDQDFIDVGKRQVANNCCSSNKDNPCVPCPMLEGAHVTWAKAGNGDAAHGRRVEVGFEGPHVPELATTASGGWEETREPSRPKAERASRTGLRRLRQRAGISWTGVESDGIVKNDDPSLVSSQALPGVRAR